MKLSLETICDSITKWSIRAVFFLTPIFFLPLTPYPVDLNKQFIFTTFVAVGALAFLVKSAWRRKIEYPKNYAGAALGALLVLVGISAFFSGASALSFMGQTGGEADTALAVISFTLFYFLVAVSFKEKSEIIKALITLMVSGSLAVLYGIMQAFFGPLLPWGFAAGGTFNAVGSMNAFGLYVGFIALLSFAVFQYVPITQRMRIWAGILSATSFVFILLLGFWTIFTALLVGLTSLVVMRIRTLDKKIVRGNGVSFAVLAVLLCMLIIASGIISVPVPRIASPAEVSPSIGASLRLAVAAARTGFKNFVVGSGPATYQYEYALHHDANLNGTVFWNVQFAQGFNALTTYLVSWGVLGVGIFLVFIALIVAMSFCLGSNRRADHLTQIVIALFAYSVALLCLYPQNFVLCFLFFACAGMVTALASDGKGGYGSASLPLYVVVPLGVLIVGGLVYVNTWRYVGAVQFGRGMRITSEAKDANKALPLLVSGVKWDPYNGAYFEALASAYLSQANALASVEKPDDEVRKAVASAITSAIASAERATQVNPRNAAHWIALAQVYEAVAPLNANAASSVIPVYGKAAALDPLNPAILASIGTAYMRAAGVEGADATAEYAKAQASFEQAIILKEDYALAYFGLIRVFESTGRGADAVLVADRLRSIVVGEPQTLFQLGVAHYEAGRNAKAQEIFEQVIASVPDYANALYFSGLTYEKQGNRARAITQLERVAQLNPDNAEVKAMLEKLRTEKPTLKKKNNG